MAVCCRRPYLPFRWDDEQGRAVTVGGSALIILAHCYGKQLGYSVLCLWWGTDSAR